MLPYFLDGTFDSESYGCHNVITLAVDFISPTCAKEKTP